MRENEEDDTTHAPSHLHSIGVFRYDTSLMSAMVVAQRSSLFTVRSLCSMEAWKGGISQLSGSSEPSRPPMLMCKQDAALSWPLDVHYL